MVQTFQYHLYSPFPALLKSDPGYGVDFPVPPLLTLSRSHQIGPWLWCRLSSTTFTHPSPLSSNRTLVMVQTFEYDLYSPFPALIKSDPGYGANFPVPPLLTLFCCFSSNRSCTNTGIPVLDLSSMDLGRLGLLDVYRMGWP